MIDLDFAFEAEPWLWKGEGAAWVFATLPRELSADIWAFAPGRRGFGAVKVEVTVGGTTWRTSLFPSREREAYMLPLKTAVRAAEGLEVGEPATFTLRVPT